MKKVVVILILLCSVLVSNASKAGEYAVLTVEVSDIYGDSIDNARVHVDYVYRQDEDVDITDQFTRNGAATFYLETEREYIVSVAKAGFLPYTDTVELEEDTTLSVTMEYAQNVPVLHMKRYSLSPEQVGPGESFQLHVVIGNEGTGDALNVRIAFETAQNFSPVQPSSSAYLERLDVGEITSIRQTFTVSGEALSGVYNLTLTISYSDAAGLSYSLQETVGISILRKPLIRLLNVEYPREVGEAESFTFSVDVANVGRYTVNGLYLEVESDLDWEYTSYYIGSLEAGDFDTFESEVVPKYAGEHTFVIRVGFVDDFNREHYQEESFSLSVTEKAEETSPPQEEKGLWQKFIDFLKSFLGLD